jgi:hypothetical protein
MAEVVAFHVRVGVQRGVEHAVGPFGLLGRHQVQRAVAVAVVQHRDQAVAEAADPQRVERRHVVHRRLEGGGEGGFEVRAGGGLSLGWMTIDRQVRDARAPFGQLAIGYAL